MAFRFPLRGPTLARTLPALLVALAAVGAARAEVWPASEYEQIQNSIEQAEYGDTVLVAPGTYGRLVLRPGIRLIAEKGPEETHLEHNTYWVVKAEGVDSLTVIDGFSLSGGGAAEGVILAKESSLTVKNCVIRGGWSGVRGLYCNMTIDNCTIQECQNGIYLFESEGVVVDNDIQLCITGITLVSSSPRVLRNTITRNTLGLRVAEHSDPSIGGTIASANRVWNNVAGAVKNEAYLKRQGIRTMKPMTLRVPYNFWGSDCPDTILFRGPMEWAPWVDVSGKRSIDHCEESDGQAGK
jgi:parallel beta-helix repeat protein